MSDVIYIEFVYENGNSVEHTRSIWNAYASFSNEQYDLSPSNQFNIDREISIKKEDDDSDASAIVYFKPVTDPSTNPRTPDDPCVEAMITTHMLRRVDESGRLREVELIIDVIRTTYEILGTKPQYVFGIDEGHAVSLFEGDRSPPLSDDIPVERYDLEVSWLMLFPPEMVKSYGKEFLLDAPVWRTEELNDGAILIVASPDPTDFGMLDETMPDLKKYFSADNPQL